jgi:hypothetical protein
MTLANAFPAFVATLVVAGAGGALANPRFIPIQSPDETRCPELARGAKLTVDAIDGGVEFEITTPRPRYEQELRDLARAVAEVVEQQSNEVSWRATMTEDNEVSIPPVEVDVADIGAGVRVTVRARRPQDVEMVRVQARMFERFWERSDCINGSPFAGLPSISA